MVSVTHCSMRFGANRFDHSLPTNKVRQKIIIIIRQKKSRVLFALSSFKSRFHSRSELMTTSQINVGKLNDKAG